MSYLQKLCETYDNNRELAGLPLPGQTSLSPICHLTQNAQIEITLDDDGCFRDAAVVPKERRETLIPVTEASAARANGIAPHPLCDFLLYVAGDYAAYLPGEKEKRNFLAHFDAYLSALNAWADWDRANAKVKAIRAYCAKRQTVSDLISAGILEADGEKLAAKKIEGNPYDKCMVRWRVLLNGAANDSAVWTDTELFRNFIEWSEFREKQEPEETGICYIGGTDTRLTYNHGKGILPGNYNSKLFSGNDRSGLTFRGRFTTPEQAYGIGYETSQKAHSALRWLIANQGVTLSGREFLFWNPKGKSVPEPLFGDDFEDDEPHPTTVPEYREWIFKMLNGGENRLEDDDDVLLLVLDAATPGRVSVTEYHEWKASDFRERLKEWYGHCCWEFSWFSKDKKPHTEVRSPNVRQIVNYAFGTQQGEMIKADDRVVREQTQRLLSCVLGQRRLPDDIVRALVTRVSQPLTYTPGNRERILRTACALIRKRDFEQHPEREELTMALNPTYNDRSYLFGRLLAIAEQAEHVTYASGEGRETNAIRLQAMFQRYPLRTWENIERALSPYFSRMNPGLRYYYKNMIGEILDCIDPTDPRLNQPLSEYYIIGYYQQRRALRARKETKTELEFTEEN